MKANLINLIIAGAGYESNLIGKSIAHSMPNDVILVSTQEATRLQLTKPVSEQFVLSNPYPIEVMTGDFVCKGKHQYKKNIKNNLVEWICQCGRKTTD